MTQKKSEKKALETVENIVPEVEQENTTQNQQEPQVEPKAVESNRRSDLIYAVRGSQKSRFSQKEWDMLGKDKAGWVVDVEVPKEVQALKSKEQLDK